MTGDKKNFPFDIQRENLIITLSKLIKSRKSISFSILLIKPKRDLTCVGASVATWIISFFYGADPQKIFFLIFFCNFLSIAMFRDVGRKVLQES